MSVRQLQRAIEDNLRRAVGLAGSVFLVVWLVWVVAVDQHPLIVQDLRDQWGLVLGLALLGGLLSLLVVARDQDERSDFRRVLAPVLPRTARGARRLQRLAWVPQDVLMVLTPLLVCRGILLQSSVLTGQMSVTDMRHAWVGSLALLATAMFAAARVELRWAVTYVLLVQAVRLAAYLWIQPTVLGDALTVCLHGALYAMSAVLGVVYVRYAASALDDRLATRASTRLAATRAVAHRAESQRNEQLMASLVVPCLERTAAADDPDEWEAVRRDAVEVLSELDDLGKAREPADLVEDPPQEIAAALTRAVAPHIVGSDVRRHLPRGRTVPVPVRDHLAAGLFDLVSRVCPGEDAEAHLTLEIVADDDHVTGTLVPLPGFDAHDELRAAVRDITDQVESLPGGSVQVTPPDARDSEERIERVELRWWDREPRVLAAVGAPRSAGRPAVPRRHDPGSDEQELADHFRVAAVLPSRSCRRVATVLLGAMGVAIVLLAVVTGHAYRSRVLDGMLVATTVLVLSLPFVREFRHGGARRASSTTLAVLAGLHSLVVLSLSLVNVADPATFASEVESWPVLVVAMVAIYFAVTGAAVFAVLLSVAAWVVMAHWGVLSGLGLGIFAGGGLHALIATLVTVSLVEWASSQMRTMALARRERRAVDLIVAHEREVVATRRAASRHLDDIVRPFHNQQVTGFPLTRATRTRAAQLAARLTDERLAPVFRDTEVMRAAADARARGVDVILRDRGALTADESELHGRVVELTVQALNAAVDGTLTVLVHPEGSPTLVSITAQPTDDEQRRTTILPDGSVDYDGILVRSPRR